MSFGKMNAFIDIISNTPAKDAEGFATAEHSVLASIRAYKEDRHGTEAWKNRAAFTTASALFRFRRIPGVTVTTAMTIVSAEDVKGRGMYTEVLAERVNPSGKS